MGKIITGPGIVGADGTTVNSSEVQQPTSQPLTYGQGLCLFNPVKAAEGDMKHLCRGAFSGLIDQVAALVSEEADNPMRAYHGTIAIEHLVIACSQTIDAMNSHMRVVNEAGEPVTK